MLKYKETIFPNTASALSVQISKHCKKIQSRLHMYVKDYCYENSLISRTIYQFIGFTFRCFLRKQTLFQLSWWLDTMGFQNFYRGDIFSSRNSECRCGHGEISAVVYTSFRSLALFSASHLASPGLLPDCAGQVEALCKFTPSGISELGLLLPHSVTPPSASFLFQMSLASLA